MRHSLLITSFLLGLTQLSLAQVPADKKTTQGTAEQKEGSKMLVAGENSEKEKSAARWDSALLRKPAAWYASDEARSFADTVLKYQSSEGAWPKNTNLLVPLTVKGAAEVEKSGKSNTIDNGATTTPMQFLALVAEATGAKEYQTAVLRGIDYLIASQYANGGFPQFFPLRKGYYSHITYNDGAMINALTLLREVASGRKPFGFVDSKHRALAAEAVNRGIDCILKTQVREKGTLTAWCAQHDEETLEPAWARAYEPPSLSGCESVGIVRFLMTIEKPSPEIIRAVDGAIAWFAKVSIKGQKLERVKRPDGRTERVLEPDDAAAPLWARFYELGTDKPLYMDRRSKPLYDFAQVDYERRSGYNYFGDWPETLIRNDYPAWNKKLGR